MTIDWVSFLIVAVVSIGAAALVVSLFAAGLRLLAVQGRRGLALTGAWACFAVAAVAVLFGIWLMVPALHGA